jgi:hypothetical protein
MKKTNKILIAIVVGVVLIIVVTFLIVFLRPEATYQSEATPAGVVHNYLLALQKEDFERAYTYLSKTLPGYPTTVSKFTESVIHYSWYFRLRTDTTLSVDTEKIVDTHAVVKVVETRFSNRGLLESSTSISTFEIELQMDGDQWRIVDADRYFVWCWRTEEGCPN